MIMPTDNDQQSALGRWWILNSGVRLSACRHALEAFDLAEASHYQAMAQRDLKRVEVVLAKRKGG